MNRACLLTRASAVPRGPVPARGPVGTPRARGIRGRPPRIPWSVAVALVPCLLAAPIRSRGEEPEGAISGPRKADLTLQDGLYHEAALNDLSRAIERYDAVLALDGARSDQLAAARTRKAICLKRSGRWLEAEREFRTVLRDFSDETPAVRLARRYVGLTSRLFPAETFLYLELVDPGNQVDFLTEVIQGTPLENPVDYYLASTPPEDPSASDTPRQLKDQSAKQLRALLNLEFLNELKKIQGLAVGLVRREGEEPGYLGVFLPGTSALSRGILTSVIGFFMETTEGTIHDVPIFRLRRGTDAQEGIYIAFHTNAEVAIVGTPLGLVEDAIRRYREPRPVDSLAGEEDFRRALEARAGGVLFTYLQRGAFLDFLRGQASGTELRDLDRLVALLGLERFEAPSLTLSRSGEDIRLALRGHPARDEAGGWNLLRTPVFEPGLSTFVPSDALGFLALATPDLVARARGLASRAREIQPELVARLPAPARDFLFSPGRPEHLRIERILSQLEQVALIVPGRPRTHPALAFLLALQFRPGHRVTEDLESAMATLLEELIRRTFAIDVKGTFRSAPELLERLPPLPGAGTVRLLELTPSWTAGYVRIGDVYLAAPVRAVLEASLESVATRRTFSRRDIPVGSSKTIFLQPREILSAFVGPENAESRNLLLSRTPRATIHTLEDESTLSVELTVPDATPILKDLLRSLQVAEPSDRRGGER